ncbi:MAG: imidazoleglycerol-phosphate dehydratase HisB [Bacillota bacterium]|jgi:imidazoleglycerol-phosphate dehydratase|nr:imidazoleglycerol-phosphate dehydratase HisB [Bacillota bacterium]HOB90629.1 imidazoleglycerol-phosphate dehydratase HisB [Bacillota bacterium]HPZ53525.1 imidazoleglycerol-phosphate dehydratase HisB [Bacillota bacterium]HQD17086.1 imidazoleglycerol-phosphate dehydratase HisB [Bacillota bacterium]
MEQRVGKSSRATTETVVDVRVTVDGRGECRADTGIGFLDHMLALFSRHGLFDLEVSCKGDLHVDYHHTVEDTGITLGLAFLQAIGDKSGIRRYGFSSVVHDEAWVMVSLDISGRPYLVCEADQLVGTDCPIGHELLVEFLRGFATSCGITLHVKALRGSNGHHIVEAVFKALGRACDEATKIDSRISGVPSTKGVL